MPEIQAVDNDVLEFQRTIVYGEPSAGKTTFLLGVAKSDAFLPALIVDTDKGIKANSGEIPRVDFYDVDHTAEAEKLVSMISDPNSKVAQYAAFLFDSITRLSEITLSDIATQQFKAGKRGSELDQQIQDYKYALARVIRLHDKVLSANKHILISAWLEEVFSNDVDDPKLIELRPKMHRGLWKAMSYRMDNIWYLTKRANGDIGIVTHKLTLPSGTVIHAKTRNQAFSRALLDWSVKQGSKDTTITIGNVFNRAVPQYTLADFYKLYNEVNNVKRI